MAAPSPDRSPARRWRWLVLAAAMGAVLYAAVPLPHAARSVVAILGFAMVVWVAEALPLGATALASSFLLVVLAGEDPPEVFAAYFDPVVVLLLGGFLLGVALQRHGLDAALAAATLRRVGRRPAAVLLAVMGLTATFSMWVSNTATTAIMLPIAVSIAGATAGLASRGRAFVLGVAAAANIGGIATPIGTTANPLALKFLAEAGEPVSFLGWMLRTAPLAALLVVVGWLILLRVHPVGGEALDVPVRAQRFTGPQLRLMALFAATVLLWLTGDWHGLSPAVVALGAGVALFVLGLLGEEDIPRAGWGTLLLIGGSIALGEAVQRTGIDAQLAERLAGMGAYGPTVAFLTVALAGVALTLVSSNTAAAVVLVPLSLQWAPAWGVPVAALAMAAAVSVSFDFLVPMGTPPNAMARATGLVDVRGMLRSGAWITLAAVAALVAAARFLW